jgi:hypothetical protein
MGDDDSDHIRRVLAHRAPELSPSAIVEALGESVWLDAVAAIGEVLDALEENLTGMAAKDEAPDYVEDAVAQEGRGDFARRVA